MPSLVPAELLRGFVIGQALKISVRWQRPTEFGALIINK